jgi:uncharacterized protein
VGVELVDGMESNRQVLSLASLVLVLGWLIVRYRSVARAVLPLVPVLVALGASTVVLHLLGVELTPLSTVAGPLVIAIATEFAVLIAARYDEERRRGATPENAIALGVTRMGGAIVASGVTLLGGFAVLGFSELPLLRDFGIVVAIDVFVALLSALVLLPPLLAWADNRAWLRGRGTAYDRVATAQDLGTWMRDVAP